MLLPRTFVGLAMLATLAACSGDASRANALGGQAQQFLDGGQLGEAQKTIILALKERDDLPALQILKGRIELAADHVGPAFDAFAAALSLEATNPEALQGVAQLGLRTGHIRESEDAADRILSLQPDQPDALLIKGLLAMVRNRPAETIGFANRILNASPTSEGGAILKARALYMQGDLGGALKFLRTFNPSAGDTDGLAQTRLELLRQAGDAGGMLAEFATLRKLLPKNFNLRIDEANLRYKTGDRAGARSLLRAVLFNLRPDATQTSQLTALWFEYDRDPLDEGEFDELATNSNEATRVGVARYYLDSGRPAIAHSLLSGAVSLEARALDARSAIVGGQPAAGAAAADRILATDQTQCDALIARSEASAVNKKWSDAVLAAQTAAAECPQNIQASLALARAYQGQEKPSGVRRAFADGITQNPQDPILGGAFSGWLETIGESRQAVAEARRRSRRTPALVSAWVAYRDLCARLQDAGCAADARAGLSRANTLLGIDPSPGVATARGLIGRLPSR